MITSLFLVDDEELFHIVFDDACSTIDLSYVVETCYTTDDAEDKFKVWMEDRDDRPECAFIDLNIIGSSYDGIELVRRINTKYGNGLVIGIISSSQDQVEIDKAREAGAMFWIVKSDDIEPRLEQFKEDYAGYQDGTQLFKVYA